MNSTELSCEQTSHTTELQSHRVESTRSFRTAYIRLLLLSGRCWADYLVSSAHIIFVWTFRSLSLEVYYQYSSLVKIFSFDFCMATPTRERVTVSFFPTQSSPNRPAQQNELIHIPKYQDEFHCMEDAENHYVISGWGMVDDNTVGLWGRHIPYNDTVV